MRSLRTKCCSRFPMFMAKMVWLLWNRGKLFGAAIFSISFPFVSCPLLFSFEKNKLETSSKQENNRQDSSWCHVSWPCFWIFVCFLSCRVEEVKSKGSWLDPCVSLKEVEHKCGRALKSFGSLSCFPECVGARNFHVFVWRDQDYHVYVGETCDADMWLRGYVTSKWWKVNKSASAKYKTKEFLPRVLVEYFYFSASDHEQTSIRACLQVASPIKHVFNWKKFHDLYKWNFDLFPKKTQTSITILY